MQPAGCLELGTRLPDPRPPLNGVDLAAWHDRCGRGPADHPLLQPDLPYWGFRDLTKEEAEAIDAERLRQLHDRQRQSPEQAA